MSNEVMQPDVLIIGSGPAGVSAAWPLVEAGISVLMLDQGKTGNSNFKALDGRSLHDIRTRDPEQWKRFLGKDFSTLKPRGMVSPKLKVPNQQFAFDGFKKAYAIHTNNFHAIGSLAQGGLSNVWGAGAYVYDDEDLIDFPINRNDIAASAKRIAKRIGLSGSLDDDMAEFYGDDIPLQPAIELDQRAAALFNRYQINKPQISGTDFSLGRARNAVLSKPLGPRGGCLRDDMCLWGCERGAIYNAAQELVELKKNPNFTYHSGIFVNTIERRSNMYTVITSCPVSYKSKYVVLAAGTLGSTALALRHLDHINRDIPLYSNPTLALPLVLPHFLGDVLPKANFALGQLGFKVRTPELENTYAHGVIFAASGLPASEFIRHIPLSRPVAIRLFRALQPALLIANCFLPGRFSQNTLKITNKNGATALEIVGGYTVNLDGVIKSTAKALSAHFRKLGGYALPGGVQASEPGADIHYAGTLPMCADGQNNGSNPHTNTFGCLQGSNGLYVVDGAVLNQVAAKNPTFSIMANADRISRHIVTKLKS